MSRPNSLGATAVVATLVFSVSSALASSAPPARSTSKNAVDDDADRPVLNLEIPLLAAAVGGGFGAAVLVSWALGRVRRRPQRASRAKPTPEGATPSPPQAAAGGAQPEGTPPPPKAQVPAPVQPTISEEPDKA
ncbi:MAG: hypothetical protein U0271_13005 [Polyangiaceae bacterium]